MKTEYVGGNMQFIDLESVEGDVNSDSFCESALSSVSNLGVQQVNSLLL
jgi:hypothetical protein